MTNSASSLPLASSLSSRPSCDQHVLHVMSVSSVDTSVTVASGCGLFPHASSPASVAAWAAPSGPLQALVLSALEPECEARFEPKSYGFWPGRGWIVAIHTTASHQDAGRLWVLDADPEAAFDRLSHQHILASLGFFPARSRTATRRSTLLPCAFLL